MALAPGSRIGSYEVTALIGAGGMGEVYRATDKSLGRSVAIKVLPGDVAADPERLARFRREAQLLASLNHPNIAAIHGIEESGGTPFLVLELVEGEDLAQRLARGPLPPDEAIEVACRIASALEEAHDKGIVHRDLKPANVKMAPDGKVKVLDFGLAKALTASALSDPAADLSQSPTVVQSGTQAGVILGTAAYMSPEQARGRAVDRRADIWAFGVVLWEMLTGRPLFAGETFPDIVAAVLTRDPDWTALPESAPPHIRRLLRRCLERDPRRRLQAIGEARIDLESAPGEAEAAPAIGSAPPPAISNYGWLKLAGIAVVAAGFAVAATVAFRPGSPAPAVSTERVSFTIDPPVGHHFVGGLALSRDGKALAFSARDPEGQTALWVRPFDAVEPHRIEGTDGALYPFWAPDGRRLGFFASGEMRVVDRIGGAVRTVTRTANEKEVRGATWGAGDIIVFAPTYTGPLLRIAASGGEPAPATHLDAEHKEGTHRWPSFLPDGRHFLFYASGGSGTEPGAVRLGALDSDDAPALTAAHSEAVFLPPRFILFTQGTSLVAQEIDLENSRLAGEPVPLGISLQGSIGISGFRYLSSGGAATFVHRQVRADITRVVWADRSGRELATVCDDGGWHTFPHLSPDGHRVALAHYDAGKTSGDIQVHDAERQLDTRVTYDDNDDTDAVWSPDGRMLAVSTISAAEPGNTYLVDPSRPGERRLRYHTGRVTSIAAWFPDGGLLLSINDQNSRSDLYRLPPEPATDLVPILVSPFSEADADVSSDGRWLVYVSDSTGRIEVYVRSLESGEEWRVSKGGGANPTWRKDGRELYYLDSRGILVAVPTTLGTKFSMGTPEPLFAGLLEDSSGRQYDVAPDGRRFILNRRRETAEHPIVVTIGLPEKLAAGRHP